MHTRYALVLAVAVSFLTACVEPNAPASPGGDDPGAPLMAAGPQAVPGQYIVVYKDAVAVGDVDEKIARAQARRPAGMRVQQSFRHALKGFAAQLTPEALEELRADPDVAYIEPDQEMSISATQTGATWGIDRIDQRNRPLSGTYTYTSTASTVYAYIIDTGIQTSHSQFGGRASNVYDAFGGNGQDCHGHGTHVAGTVGSSTYGIAKAVRLRGLRVLNCSGSGSTSGIIAAIDWLRANYTAPAVANMSLGGGYSTALNSAVTNLSNAGVFMAVAAGNENQNACNVSPASASGVATVAASTSSDAKASYSNYGSCVELYAPGSSITSTWLSGGTRSISGTSMASPHVAGVAALYKGNYGNASSSTILSWLINNATANVISGNRTGTPNRLLYKGSL